MYKAWSELWRWSWQEWQNGVVLLISVSESHQLDFRLHTAINILSLTTLLPTCCLPFPSVSASPCGGLCFKVRTPQTDRCFISFAHALRQGHAYALVFAAFVPGCCSLRRLSFTMLLQAAIKLQGPPESGKAGVKCAWIDWFSFEPPMVTGTQFISTCLKALKEKQWCDSRFPEMYACWSLWFSSISSPETFAGYLWSMKRLNWYSQA